MVLAALAALAAAIGSIPAAAISGPERVMVEIWRLAGLVVFSGLFALLAYRPIHYAGVWELVIANKLTLTLLALALAHDADGAMGVVLVDGVLTAVLLTAYVLNKAWRAWSCVQDPL